MKAANKEQAQRLEQVMKLLETYRQQSLTIKSMQDTKIEELRELVNGFSYQQGTLLLKLQFNARDSNTRQNNQTSNQEEFITKFG